MPLDRRRLLTLGAAATAAGTDAITRAAGAANAREPISAFGLDAAQFGLRAGSPDNQSRALQRALDQAAQTRVPLALAPGVYRVGNVRLGAGAQLVGVRGATRLVLGDGSSLLVAEDCDHVTLAGLVLDGLRRPLPQGRALVQLDKVRSIRITDCEIASAGGTAIGARAVDGEISGTTISDAADAAIHSLDARGLVIARNTILDAGNNGIQVWRGEAGDDGTLVVDNRIGSIRNVSGGSGQYGNAINVFRAGNVIVRGNRINNCAFSAVRGNAASNITIEGNSISNVREVALYAEFGFEGALIANNSVDGAAIGISVTNFNRGGRLAVVQGNMIRNLLPVRPGGTDLDDEGGVGIAVEADTTVVGNIIESAPKAGITLGFGAYLRDLVASANVVRRAGVGIGVSVTAGAGMALIANNLLAETKRGAIVGFDRNKIVTADLTMAGAERLAHLTLINNSTR